MTVGRVAAIGSGITEVAPGERILCGGNHASHYLLDLGNPNANEVTINLQQQGQGDQALDVGKTEILKALHATLGAGDPDLNPEGIQSILSKDIPEVFARCQRMIGFRRYRASSAPCDTSTWPSSAILAVDMTTSTSSSPSSRI